VIVVAASRDPNAKITTLLLRDGDKRPALAVKAPTSEAAARVVRAEAELLLGLRKVLPPDLLATVPRVVRPVDTVNGVMATTAVAGTPMQVAYHRWHHVSRPSSVARDFTAVDAWLERLHAATADGRAPLDLAARLAPELRRRFGHDAELPAALAVLATVHERLADRSSPSTVVHGDFWHGNVLTDRGAVVGVIDWEAGTLRGDPVRDVARFALAYALYLDRHTRPGAVVRRHPGVVAGDWGAGVRSVLTGGGWFARLVHGFVAGRLDALGIGGDVWREVLLVALAEAAATADDRDFARRHLVLLGASAPDTATSPGPTSGWRP
jgi:hypothetical protein